MGTVFKQDVYETAAGRAPRSSSGRASNSRRGRAQGQDAHGAVTAGQGRQRAYPDRIALPTLPSIGTGPAWCKPWRPAAAMKPPPGKCWRTWNAQAERCARGVMTGTEAAIGDIMRRRFASTSPPISATWKPPGTCEFLPANARRHLDRLAADCSFRRLADLQREALERWLSRGRAKAWGPGPATPTCDRCCFGNWCVETKPARRQPVRR